MRTDYHTFRKNYHMRKYTVQASFLLLLALTATSCVDRKTNQDEDTVRLEAPKDNSADTEFTEESDMTPEGENPKLSNEDMVALTEAKGVINDYYNAFTRKAPREAYDMWDADSNNGTFADFSEKNPNYEKIEVAFTEEDTQMKTVDSVSTATIPVRISATDADGNISSSSGVVRLKKNAKADNSKFKIESMDLKKEDS